MNYSDEMGPFLDEAHEMLHQWEQYLLRLEGDGNPADVISEIFRIIHTMKGSAGLYGLDVIESCLHGLEHHLSELRSSGAGLDERDKSLLFDTQAHLQKMIQALEDQEEIPSLPGELQSRLDQLEGNTGSGEEEKTAAMGAQEFTAAAITASSEGEPPGPSQYRINIRCKPELFLHGFDPASFLRYLGQNCQWIRVEALDHAIPLLSELNPEKCYLEYSIECASALDERQVRQTFGFAEADLEIEIQRIGQWNGGNAASPEGAGTASEMQQSEENKGSLHTPSIPQNGRSRSNPAPQRKARRIRVDADRLDTVINMIGEAVSLGAALQEVKHSSEFARERVDRLLQLLEMTRSYSLGLRMVTLEQLFQRAQRQAQDLGRELGKPIHFESIGADTDLDRNIVERLSDPLVHLIRNSMDHGVETAGEREASGKEPVATLKLQAWHEAGEVVVQVEDDGRGLNAAQIRRKARSKGLLEDGTSLNEEQTYRLLFSPGFSTADQVTELSGRGVGLDAVRRAIEGLRGRIEVTSKNGHGTTFRMRLPLTLANIDGLLFRVGNNKYMVPIELVREVMELSDRLMVQPGRNIFHYREHVHPFINLKEYFGELDEFSVSREEQGQSSAVAEVQEGLENTGAGDPGQVASPGEPESSDGSIDFERDETPGQGDDTEAKGRDNIVVLKSGKYTIGLLVGPLIGRIRSVIRPPGDLLEEDSGINGFGLLGDGSVAMILDVPFLIRTAKEEEKEQLGEHYTSELATRGGYDGITG